MCVCLIVISVRVKMTAITHSLHFQASPDVNQSPHSLLPHYYYGGGNGDYDVIIYDYHYYYYFLPHHSTYFY